MATIKVKRGSRSQINTAASASGLNQGELYLITDEDVLAVGTAVGSYTDVNSSSGGGSGSSYIEHSSTVSDSLAISAGTNRMYVGRTDFSSGGVTMAGTLVVAGGYANFTSASALNITGTLNVI
jgi:hypothetical protein